MIDFIVEIISRDTYIQVMVLFALLIFLGILSWYVRHVAGINAFRKKVRETLEKDTVEERIFLIHDYFNKGPSKITTKFIKSSWDRFDQEYKSSQQQYVPDVYEYFKEDQLVYKAGYRKFIEVIPSLFVSLGILGTFWGISTGIADINSQGSLDDMQMGINTLLDGMRFAFYSSIIGIVISLLFQLFDRLILYKMITYYYDQLMFDLDRALPIKTEGSLLEELVNAQENQMNDLKSFFSDVMIPQLTSGISETVSQSLNPHLEKSNQIMEKVAQNTMDAQSDKLNEMVNYFVESLNQVTGDHMKNLGDALSKTVEWQEKVHSQMSTLVEELSSVAEKQAEMAKNTTELSEQMNDYTETLSDYQDKMISSTQELNSITEQNTSLLEQMRALSEEMNNRHQESDDNFAKKLDQMNNTVEKITQLGAVMNDIQEETSSLIGTLNKATTTMDHSIENNRNLTNSLITQHELSNQWSEKTQFLLEDLVQNSEINETMQTQMNELFEKVSNEREKLDLMKQEHANILENSVNELKNYWSSNKEMLWENREQFESLNNMLSQSMDDFAEHMHRGVQRTFEQFDESLKQAVQYLERGVNGITQVVDSMEQDMDRVNGQISRFNQSIEQIAAGTKQ